MNPQKPGIRSSEFWLSAAAVVVGFVESSGVLDTLPNPWPVKVVGLLVALLAALGYTVPRIALKQAQVKADAVTALNAAESKGVQPPANPTP